MNNIVVSRNFIDDYNKCKYTITVPFKSEAVNKIEEFVTQITKVKLQENHHKIDNRHEDKRFLNGIMGECAIEHALGLKFVDWTIGDSKNYEVADLKALGINIGVKSSAWGKYPVIPKNPERPEIICIREYNNMVICGLATVDVLKKYQDDNLILSPELKRKGTKTGFYGFDHLIKFSTLEDLKKYSV